MSVTLKGMTWDHPRGYDPLIVCSKVYKDLTGVEVQWDRRSLKDFGDQPIDELTQAYDVLIIDHPHAGIAAETGCIVALDEWLNADTLATLAQQSAGPSHQSYEYAGHQWGLAVDAAMQAAVYRADLLNEAIPATWDSVIALGQRVRADGRYIAMPLAPTDAICSFVSLCSSLGHPIGAGGHLVDEATGRHALEILRDIQQVAHRECVNWNPIHMLDYMSTADDAVYCPLTFCYTNYSRDGFRDKRLTFTVIPGVKGSILGGTGFAVSSFCEHKSTACDFGAWLCSAEVQRTHYVQSGGQPGNIIAWQDEQANAVTNGFFSNTLPTLEQSFVRPRHEGFIPFQEAAGNTINAFLKDGSDIADCLSKLNTLYEENK